MGEATTEASGRFGGATCKVVFSEPCRETRGGRPNTMENSGRPAQNLGRPAVGGPCLRDIAAGFA